MAFTFKSAQSRDRYFNGKHRFEHWYRDNQVYFITARCRDRRSMFRSEAAKTIFWERFDRCTGEHGFVPWVTTLLDNHYHTLGYLRAGTELPKMMQKLHGSVAKRVNDLHAVRLRPFWRDTESKNYMDGCLRDETQCRRTYRYVLKQSERHGACADWRDYAHTRVAIELERGLKRALELNAFLEGVRYKRYERGGRRR